MAEEYESIMMNDVRDVVPRPKGKSMVTSEWLFKIKHGFVGSIEKYKARFMAWGFSQKEGEDYDDKFALVARSTTIHSIVSLVASQGCDPTSDGHKDNTPPWHVIGRSVHWAATGIWSRGSKDTCLQIEEGIIWFKANPQSMVRPHRNLFGEAGIHKK